MSKLITVFGATGNQGGSVIYSILADPWLSKEFKIRGITRDTTKKSAQDLAKRGVDVVSVRFDLHSFSFEEIITDGNNYIRPIWVLSTLSLLLSRAPTLSSWSLTTGKP